MKNPAFNYHRPESLEAALALLAAHGDDAKVLAGGQSLLPVMALRLAHPTHLIDINRVPGLDQITVSADGTSLGALVRHAQAERSPELATTVPLAHAAMPHIGHRAIRSQGTVCGSIAHADPAAEMPAVCLAAEATLVAASSAGRREIPAAEFFAGYLTTALEPNEILTEVRFPPRSADAATSVVEISRRHGDYALVGVACSLDIADGVIAQAALAFFGVASTPVRVARAETSLAGAPLADPGAVEAAAARAGALVSESLDPAADVHASADYRRHLAGVLTRRAIDRASARPTTGVPV